MSLSVFIQSCDTSTKAENSDSLGEEWEILFNGKDLTGWTPKITGFELGDNAMNTFRVKDGVIDINYSEYDTFTNQFGHLFYKNPYSSYHMEVEYRFKGEQTPGGPGWAYRNSGIMFHSQDPTTMLKDQDFPVCVEFQFLGGNGTDERSTGNLCTPNTHINIDGELVTTHCINSTSPTYHGDQWVTAGLIVYEDSIVYHLIEGDTVMTYTDLIFDARGAPEGSTYVDGQPIISGYVALQGESHPMEYRSVKIKNLAKQ
jgi:hypothetical protein